MPDQTTIHELSVANTPVSSLTFNKGGEWLGVACKRFGQLLVWEWQSETYVLKQQGHSYGMSCMAYSPNGKLIATGGRDGKIKVWNTNSGFCFVTFSDHQGPVTSLTFSQNGNVILSAGQDGTTRAFDMTRYKNFRTMVPPQRTQISALAADPSGEIIVGSSLDNYEIYVWSLQTGNLLDILAGHEGPISCLSFSPIRSVLFSSSWDKTARSWDVFENKPYRDILQHNSDVLTLAIRPDGKELCTSDMTGTFTFWHIDSSSIVGLIEAKKDLGGGRVEGNPRLPTTNTENQYFTSVSYSADGTCVIAGGNTNIVCIYQVAQRVLVKRFLISKNFSLDNISRRREEPKGSISHYLEEDTSERSILADHSLPGVKTGDFSKRNVKPIMKTEAVTFSPTGRSFGAVTVEGLLIYSLDSNYNFDPFELEMNITTDAIETALQEGEYLKSLLMSFKLNEKPIIKKVYENIPYSQIKLVVENVPTTYLARLVGFVAQHMETSPHLEFDLCWVTSILNFHGPFFSSQPVAMFPTFRQLQKVLTRQRDDVVKLSEDNSFTLDFVCHAAKPKDANANGDVEIKMEPMDDDDMKDEAMESEDADGQGFDEWITPDVVPAKEILEEEIASVPKRVANDRNGNQNGNDQDDDDDEPIEIASKPAPSTKMTSKNGAHSKMGGKVIKKIKTENGNAPSPSPAKTSKAKNKKKQSSS
eukprot:TRINITY_DN4701_c0_g1_i1.p1 TRINITY_DN4701_c0_g1~~TRINITY_DN4701_c0_g1_i1.p1  ORF type:complete len:702 (-),score=243.40 TRINITY_DN4701_c0_g1_i1:55-2160(-)